MRRVARELCTTVWARFRFLPPGAETADHRADDDRSSSSIAVAPASHSDALAPARSPVRFLSRIEKGGEEDDSSGKNQASNDVNRLPRARKAPTRACRLHGARLCAWHRL